MSKTCFLFAGQGSQYPGMGLELAARCAKADEIFTCAGDILHLDLKKLYAEASPAELAQTKVSQPAIFTTSLLAFECLNQEGVAFDGVGGHSLGEYAAMVASGVVSMEDGFALIGHRAAAMQKCAEANPGSMCAVMGMPAEEIEKVCETIDGYVIPVNYNSTQQTVLAGTVDAIDQAVEAFTARKKRAVKLAVSAAFHSALMQDAAAEFGELAKIVTYHPAQKDFFANSLGDVLTDFSDMPGYLSRHIASPVYFTRELEAAQAKGYDQFVELGPGKVLTGLVKRTLKGVTAMNIEDEKTLSKALETLKA